MRLPASPPPRPQHRRSGDAGVVRTVVAFAVAAGVTAALAIPAFATGEQGQQLATGVPEPHPQQMDTAYGPRGYGHDLSGGSTLSDSAPDSGPPGDGAPPAGTADEDLDEGDEPVDSSTRVDARERAGRDLGEDGRQTDSDRGKGGNAVADGAPVPRRKGWNRVHGMDVSSHQPTVDWDYWWREGKRFVFIKATEGTNFQSRTYAEQWKGSREAGMLRGAYHFALPDGPSGAAQAQHFVKNGGGGKADGWTLPGVLDIEFGEAVGRPTCYNQSAGEIVDWIRDFTTTYKKLTGRTMIIYSNATWWEQCTGNSTAFRGHPLWLASYNPVPGDPPGGWDDHLIWQYTDTPLDQNVFKGTYDELKALARR